MAAMASSGEGGSDQAPRLPMPSRNPLPLSASQEAQVRDLFYQRVRKKCAAEIKAFADCAMNRTFTAGFACREPHRLMNSCMKAHATQAEHDAAREEWFARRVERARERERRARRAAEQEAFIREWWGLPEKKKNDGPDPSSSSSSDAAARSREAERVGGFPAASRRTLSNNNNQVATVKRESGGGESSSSSQR